FSTVDVGKMGADFACGESAGIQREDHFVDVGEASLALLDDMRFEGAGPIARHVDLNAAARVSEYGFGAGSVAGVATSMTNWIVAVIPEVLRELLVQGGFDDRLGHRFEQTARASQCNTGFSSLAHQLAGDFEFVNLTATRDIDRRRSG